MPYFNGYTKIFGVWEVYKNNDISVLAEGSMCESCGHVDPIALYFAHPDVVDSHLKRTNVPYSMGASKPWIRIAARQLSVENTLVRENGATLIAIKHDVCDTFE